MRTTDLTEKEFAPFYSGYIQGLKTEELIDSLETTAKDFTDTLQGLSEKEALYSYAEGKWTIKELIQHIIDAERVLSYRAMRFSRKDNTNLPGFEEDWYVSHSNGNDRPLQELLKEFESLRKSCIAMFKSFSPEMLILIGKANNSNLSVRALGFIIAGHQHHHLKIIKSAYLKSEDSK